MIQCLYDTQLFVELTKGTEEWLVLETHLRRQRNRVADALSDASATVDSTLERFPGLNAGTPASPSAQSGVRRLLDDTARCALLFYHLEVASMLACERVIVRKTAYRAMQRSR